MKKWRDIRSKYDKEGEKRIQAMKDELLKAPKLTPLRDPAAEAIAKEAEKPKK